MIPDALHKDIEKTLTKLKQVKGKTLSERLYHQWDKEKKKLDAKYRVKAEANFIEWRGNQSTDHALLHKALDFEDRYFKDLTMSLKEFSRTLTHVSVQDPDSGKWIEEENGFDQTFFLSLHDWITTYTKLPDGIAGQCLGPSMTIQIRPGLTKEEENLTLLHEMIHAYEFNLGKECETYKQYLILWLFNKLGRRVHNLMKLVNTDNHLFCRAHSPLFMLKSLDLDLRLKKPLGTVYSYGRKKLFR